MKRVISFDGTPIAFDEYGSGPTLLLIGGALQHRAFDTDTATLATLLAPDFTVLHYDRRGRGDSGDTAPYAVEREIEDIRALIDAAGGSACVFGISSGAALAMQASIKLGDRIQKLAMYEAPFDDDAAARQAWLSFCDQLLALLARDQRGAAIAAFLSMLGTSADALQGMSHAPVWPMFEAVAPTLAYDLAILGDSTIPVEQSRQVRVPTLLMEGGMCIPSMRASNLVLARNISGSRHYTVAGQTHFVAAEALAPVLKAFFGEKA